MTLCRGLYNEEVSSMRSENCFALICARVSPTIKRWRSLALGARYNCAIFGSSSTPFVVIDSKIPYRIKREKMTFAAPLFVVSSCGLMGGMIT